ncbi:hypothetical protein BDC45DRAFT_248178 [Circinella umbellata]|nr:hypothetical protein BDC45DRAFT_248178 [Circinella umbellata]
MGKREKKKHKLKASSPVSASTTNYWRPLTPPREGSNHHHRKSPSIPPVNQFPPSPPHQPQQPQKHQVPYLPPLGKFDQTIRGCEIWTREDDRILIEHMLNPTHPGERWRELEAKLEGRHTAKLCSHRWEYLQSFFLKALENVSSPSISPTSSTSSSSITSNSSSSTSSSA